MAAPPVRTTRRAARWNPNCSFAELPGPPRVTWSEARGITWTGVIVGLIRGSDGLERPARWNLDGTVTELVRLPGGFLGFAEDISDAGVVVGLSNLANSDLHAVRRTAGGSVADPGSLPDFVETGAARAIKNGVMGGVGWVRLRVCPRGERGSDEVGLISALGGSG